MATKRTKKAAAKKVAAKKAPASPPSPAKPAPGVISNCMSRLDMTALAWVTAIRIRVRELVDDVDRVTAMIGNPTCTGAEVVLKTVIDIPALNRLFNRIEEVERIVETLLTDDGIVDPVPYLAGMCRTLAEEIGLEIPTERET